MRYFLFLLFFAGVLFCPGGEMADATDFLPEADPPLAEKSVGHWILKSLVRCPGGEMADATDF
ncbi:MAG: hypothetical protein PHG65_10780, partial [Kiritimatiellae bacterium]|nr:hypothetical protein [Kiritimatiellia bacterium]